MDIRPIQRYVKEGNYRFSDHAIKQMAQRNISREEVEEAVISGIIIEEYPKERYKPSCLIFGETTLGRILHVVCSLPPEVVIITTYEPDPSRWLEGKTKRML